MLVGFPDPNAIDLVSNLPSVPTVPMPAWGPRKQQSRRVGAFCRGREEGLKLFCSPTRVSGAREMRLSDTATWRRGAIIIKFVIFF